MFPSPVVKAAFFIIICLLALPAWGQNRRAPIVRMEHFSVEEGLADRDARDIVKDRQGYIWIATSKGLIRFDGYDFLTYDTRPRNPHQISVPGIFRLLLDPADNLLIQYEFPGKARFDLLDPRTGRLEAVTFERSEEICMLIPPFQSPDGTIYTLVCHNAHLTMYRFDPTGRRFKWLFEIPDKRALNYSRINFLRTSDGTFWIAYNTYAGKSLSVTKVDSTGRTLQTFELPDVDKEHNEVSDISYSFLIETTDGNIWVASAYDCIYMLDPKGANTFQRHPFFTEGNLAFSKDGEKNLIVYQQNTKSVSQRAFLLTKDGARHDYSWLFGRQGMIADLFSEDFTQNLFTGSRNGFYKYWLSPMSFATFLDQELGNSPFGISTRGMAKFGPDNLMIGTESDGVFELNLRTGQITKPGDRSPQLKPLDQFKLIRNILSQGDSVFWISGRNQVIKYKPIRNEAVIYNTGEGEIWGIAQGKNGHVWLANHSGQLLRLDTSTGAISEYKNKDGSPPMEGSQPTCLITDHNGVLWAGSTLAGLIRIDPEKGESRNFTANAGDPAGFNSNQIACIHEDKSGLLWIGTLEGGLHVFDPAKGKVIALYTRENGLCHNSVVGILPNGKGNYWLSTFNGLSFFDTRLKTFRNYSTDDGLSYNEFNRHSFFYDKEAGRYFFGGLNGVNTFAEKDLGSTENHAPLLIPWISYALDNDSIITKYEGIGDGSVITLPPGNGFLHLRLALADYRNPAGNQFSYLVEGLDKDWNYLGSNRELRLDHLPAGSYTLRLRGADHRGNWSTREITIYLEVQTYWYNRWWAWMIYIFMLATAGFYFYRFQLGQKIAQKEAQRLQDLDTFKSRFFTNITHEFRTPLTVILGTTDQLTTNDQPPKTENEKGKLRLIKRNGESLLRLINQILDLAKLESNSLQMNYVQGDILPYLRYISESLHSLANAQNVLVRVESPEPEIMMDYDPERLLQIVHNLLSNAIKFTPSGGQVILKADLTTFQKLSNLNLTVTDTGAGIPPEDLPYIFDRFYQASNLEKAKAGGTGIGLALTKELVQQMGGKISVESIPAKGTAFTATWPVTRNAPMMNAESAIYPVASLDVPDATQRAVVSPQSAAVYDLLLVEDNPDVVEYLTACLQGSYRLEFAYNGRAGIAKALETVPDLIVSDVMMPEKDGFEVCDFLKNDERTSHIPIILLTAKADLESRIAGLRRGADAYLAKPFHQEELLLTVANALESRKKLQARFAYAAVQPPAPAQDMEDVFVQKIRAAVEARLSDPSFNVDDLCRALAMSQPQLHRKLSALTGTNATLFIRAIRLEKAKVLLLQRDKTVSEVAFEVGFEDPKYFSRVFSEVFGVAPSKL